jgi:hypothetical protein
LFWCDDIVEITADLRRHDDFSCDFKFLAKDRRRNEAIVQNKYNDQQNFLKTTDKKNKKTKKQFQKNNLSTCLHINKIVIGPINEEKFII